jgi:hypothetical protein
MPKMKTARTDELESLIKCPNLRGWLATSCISGSLPFVVTRFVLQKYCRTREHVRCPFFGMEDDFPSTLDH